jgi:hypothetical protein
VLYVDIAVWDGCWSWASKALKTHRIEVRRSGWHGGIIIYIHLNTLLYIIIYTHLNTLLYVYTHLNTLLYILHTPEHPLVHP